jgi:hypothetical protein
MYFNNPCLYNCSNTNSNYTCYSNGRVLKNQCLARCMNTYPIFTCDFKKRRCKRQCRRNYRFSYSNHLIGSSRP